MYSFCFALCFKHKHKVMECSLTEIDQLSSIGIQQVIRQWKRTPVAKYCIQTSMNDMFLKVHLRDSAKFKLNLHTARSKMFDLYPNYKLKLGIIIHHTKSISKIACQLTGFNDLNSNCLKIFIISKSARSDSRQFINL